MVVPGICDAVDAIGHCVRVSGPEAGEAIRVSKADITVERDAIGVIIRKTTPTSCDVQVAGIIDDIYSSLTLGWHWIALDATLSASAPVVVPGTIDMLWSIPFGYAVASDRMLLRHMAPMGLRS